MVFTETHLVPLNKKFKRRHKDQDKEIHLNETGTTFTVVDKTWSGKITVGGHMRRGHWATRHTGKRDNPTPKLVWISTTTVSSHIKNTKKESL